MRFAVLSVTMLAVAAGCGEGPTNATDASAVADSAVVDAVDTTDAMRFPLAGFGTLSGECDVLDTELTSAEPAVVNSAIDFAQPYTPSELGQLSPGGQKIIADDNAGGSSLYSEVFAFELLRRCELAALLKTETEIVYDTPGPITDLLVAIDGVKLGVSVTRAVAFPFADPYTVTHALALLENKLAGVLASTANVSNEDRWAKQLLVVVAYAPGHAAALATALTMVATETLADTVVWVLVSDGADDFLYCDGPCSSLKD